MASRENYLKYKAKNPDKVNITKRNWEKNNPEAHARHQLRARASRKGLDPDVVEAYVSTHNGLCDLCGDPPGKRALSFDHCHDTGKFRGLLCGSCNIGLGHFKDSSLRLNLAINYLERDFD